MDPQHFAARSRCAVRCRWSRRQRRQIHQRSSPPACPVASPAAPCVSRDTGPISAIADCCCETGANSPGDSRRSARRSPGRSRPPSCVCPEKTQLRKISRCRRLGKQRDADILPLSAISSSTSLLLRALAGVSDDDLERAPVRHAAAHRYRSRSSQADLVQQGVGAVGIIDATTAFAIFRRRNSGLCGSTVLAASTASP